MPDQIVEITQPGHWLNKSRGFLAVHGKDELLGQVPLDDILAVIISSPGCSVSTALIDHLTQRSIPVVICGSNYLPASLILPVQGQGHQYQVMRAQTALSEPRRKRGWQSAVRAKISNQAEVLDAAGRNSRQLRRLVGKVKSGDPENCEAQAARIYWPSLFGADFRRDRQSAGLNAMLNYTYTVIRACVARGISAAGLHPTFSLHHKNPHNPINLVDDLMEPFRPIADYLIWVRKYDQEKELTPEIKARLASVTNVPVPLAQEASPLSLAAVKVARSYAAYCLDGSSACLWPGLPAALDIAAR